MNGTVPTDIAYCLENSRSVRSIERTDGVVGIGVGGPGKESTLTVYVAPTRAQDLDPYDIPSSVEVDGQRLATSVHVTERPRILPATPYRIELPGSCVAPPAGLDCKRPTGRTCRQRPIPAGVSCGHPDAGSGTVGVPALRREGDDDLYMLTNAHIAAPLDDAERGDKFLQPGPSDWGFPQEPEDVVGHLADAYEISNDEPNTSDSALVAVDDADLVDPTRVLELPDLAGFELDFPTDETTYYKSGRTTNVSDTTLHSTDVRVSVHGYFDDVPGEEGPAVFEHVTAFHGFSGGGDSGSLIGVKRDDGFYGTHLLFAGSGNVTFGVPLANVMDAHGEFELASDV